MNVRRGHGVGATRLVMVMALVSCVVLVCGVTPVEADTCTEGCNVGRCACYDGFECNKQGGRCVLSICSGTCTPAGWAIGVMVVIGLLIVGCIACCCWKCCHQRQGQIIIQQGPGGVPMGQHPSPHHHTHAPHGHYVQLPAHT